MTNSLKQKLEQMATEMADHIRNFVNQALSSRDNRLDAIERRLDSLEQARNKRSKKS